MGDRNEDMFLLPSQMTQYKEEKLYYYCVYYIKSPLSTPLDESSEAWPAMMYEKTTPGET